MSSQLNSQEFKQSAQSIGARFAHRLSGTSSDTAKPGTGQRAADQEGAMEKEPNTKDFGNATGVSAKGQDSYNAIGEKDSAGAIGGVGLSRDDLIQKNFDEVGQRLFGTTGTGPENATKSESTPTSADATAGGSTIPSHSEGRSLSGGNLEPNYDIKKGPITTGGAGPDQRDTEHTSTGASGSGYETFSGGTGSGHAAGSRSTESTIHSASPVVRKTSQGSSLLGGSGPRERRGSEVMGGSARAAGARSVSGSGSTSSPMTTTKVAPTQSPKASFDGQDGSNPGAQTTFGDVPTRTGVVGSTPGAASEAGTQAIMTDNNGSKLKSINGSSIENLKTSKVASNTQKESTEPFPLMEPALGSGKSNVLSSKGENKRNSPTKSMPGALPDLPNLTPWDDESDFDSDAADLETTKRVSGMRSNPSTEPSSTTGTWPTAAVAGGGAIAGAGTMAGARALAGTGALAGASAAWNLRKTSDEDTKRQSQGTSKSKNVSTTGQNPAAISARDQLKSEAPSQSLPGDIRSNTATKTSGATQKTLNTGTTDQSSSDPSRKAANSQAPSQDISSRENPAQRHPTASEANMGTSSRIETSLGAAGAMAGSGLIAGTGLKAADKSQGKKSEAFGLSGPASYNTEPAKASSSQATSASHIAHANPHDREIEGGKDRSRFINLSKSRSIGKESAGFGTDEATTKKSGSGPTSTLAESNVKDKFSSKDISPIGTSASQMTQKLSDSELSPTSKGSNLAKPSLDNRNIFEPMHQGLADKINTGVPKSDVHGASQEVNQKDLTGQTIDNAIRRGSIGYKPPKERGFATNDTNFANSQVENQDLGLGAGSKTDRNSSSQAGATGISRSQVSEPAGSSVSETGRDIGPAEGSNKATSSYDKKSSGISDGSPTHKVVKSLGSRGFKENALEEKVQAISQKCKTRIGVPSSEVSQRCSTVDAFFDTVASERLRWMPRDGSRLDSCLRWASRLAYAVDALRESVGAFAPGGNQAAKLIWGFLIMLIESETDDTEVFERIFGRYGRVAVGIHLLLQYESAYKSSKGLQPEATAVLADLLEMVFYTSTSYVEGYKSKDSDLHIGRNVDAAFLKYAKQYSNNWNAIVEFSTSKIVEESSLIYSSPEMGSLRQFLGVQDRPLQFILDSRSHTLAEGSFEWFNNTLYDFAVGQSPVLLVTGEPGAGKSALSQWTVERLQESAEHEAWNIIPYTIRADIPVATLSLRILKGILHQMLDHCVSDKQIQEAILVYAARSAQSALDGASEEEVETDLWRGIQAGLKSNIQYMFVVDGLDQIKGGSSLASAFLGQFSNILSLQNSGSKMIVFSRPLSSTTNITGLQRFPIQASQTRNDLTTYITEVLSSGFDPEHTNNEQLVHGVASIVRDIVHRFKGSFSWAEMAVQYARQQRTLNRAVAAIQSLPDSIPELLDFHLKNLDLSQAETKSIIAWLAAAERPLLVEEIEQLLSVEPKSPSFVAPRIKYRQAWSKALSPLVMTRDGVVSFAHTCIRDHVLKQAKSSISPYNIREAHHSLLVRCLAWIQLSVREESEISMDKLSMSERNYLFDKYVVLEYTARYWLSHLLSSHLVSDRGDFKFNSGFKKLIPRTVLFSRLELTCRESQFTRSSVVELYRLATDIRRSVQGDKTLALLQSLLFSAQVSRLAHASHAEENCFEAWKISQELLGQSDPITLKCAEMMTESFTQRGSMTTEQEDTLRYLILTDSEITGIDFDQRMRYLGMIVSMYKASGDDEPGLLLSKQFYQEVVQKYGINSRQSNDTAEFLTDNFSTGSDEMSRDIARTKYDNMQTTMDIADDRRIQHSLYLAQLYEQRGDNAQAESVLSTLWSGINSREIDSVDMMDKKANVAFGYYQYLRRQGRPDEADAIMRELVADLEVTGVHSPEMMQGVRLLRGETHAMRMYDLERSLSIMMWHYYKETNEQYSPEATSLALWLAESIANGVSINDTAKAMSGEDRQLIVELIDSIISSPENISVYTLILCHNLANNYMREEEWTAASECSKAALQHIWPTVEDSGSNPQFSRDLAPPMADLALVLAYCHFRRLHLEQATIVYENAFGSLSSSENVPVPSVLAVAKAVVEFYETTFQFTKALALLNRLSGFLKARLGEIHKHTIDNMYLEATLAKRLEMHQHAKDTYQRIYAITLTDSILAPEGFEAAFALIELNEKEAKWQSALEIYRHLWPSLATKENLTQNNRANIERSLEKTFMGYMAILNSHPKETVFAERYQVSSDYVTACRNVYGPTHHKTLSATLLLAELCESNESWIDKAITLYKRPLETNEWVPTSQSSKGLDQMTHSLPITLKHKLAELYVRKQDSTSEARALYTEEFQLAKKTQGYYSPTALSWLRELALAHARQGTSASVQQGNALLHTYITDILHGEDAETEVMDDWARKIATIFLECGFIEGGNVVLDELRQRVMSSSDKSPKTLGDRRDAVFVSAFEEAFGRRASSDMIMQEMAREMQMQQEFSKNLSDNDFIPALVAGDRLAHLQTSQNRTRAARDTREKLYEYFCSTLSATHVADRHVVRQFYLICLREASTEKYSTNILNTTTKLVRDLCKSSKFQEASDVTGVLHSFLHLTDGLNTQDDIITATKLCLYLSGINANKCEDPKMYSEMSLKAKLLLQEIMESSKSIGVEIVDFPFTELNDIITLLGEYEMFSELEIILTQLWTSRIVQRTWTPDVVVWIGRRLVETRFCRGSIDASIQLCRDICYNLRQVWGSCDKVTFEMTKLLSGIFTASGDHQSAAALHEGALYDLLGDVETKDHPNVADVASQHMELLRRAQARLGSGQSASRASADESLIAQVTDRFGLRSEQMRGVGEVNGGESFGVWSKPRRFSIDVEDLDDQGQVHHNHLRDSSGPGVLHGSGAPRRISVQAL